MCTGVVPLVAMRLRLCVGVLVLSLAARPKTQEITQPPASHTTQDTVIHSFQHLEPTLQHTSKSNLITPVPPPGVQHCYLQYQDSVIVIYNTPLTR